MTVANDVELDGRKHEGSIPSAEAVRQAILSGGPEDGPGQLTISNLGFFDPIDLSFDTIHTRVIFRNCALNGGLVATGATLHGLELYDVVAPVVDLDWARVEGDVRLVRVRPPQNRSKLNEEKEKDPKQPHTPDLKQTVVKSYSAAVTGEVTLAGSSVTDEQADMLMAARRPAARAGGGGFNWDLLFQAAGVGAALTAWVAIVGGATLWARMVSLDAPALPTLAALGQSWMVTAGLQTLLVPILLGAGVALLVYFSWWDPTPTAVPASLLPREQKPDASSKAAASKAAAPPTQQHGSPPGTLASAFHRSRPLVGLRRLRTRIVGTDLVAVVGVLGAILLAALYVAQASWELLVTTFLVVVSALAVVTYGVVDAFTEARTARRQQPQGTTPTRATGRRILAVVGTVAVCASIAAVWWKGGASGWQPLIASAVSLLLVVLLVGLGHKGHRDGLFGWALLAVAAIGVFLSLLVTVSLGWLVFMAVVTVLCAWISLGAMVDKSQGVVALTLFASIVVWSGALQYSREIGAHAPEFPYATVTFKTGPPLAGLLVGRTSETVLVADVTETGAAPSRTVHAVPTDQVTKVDYGGSLVLPARGSGTSSDGNGPQWQWLKPWTWSFLVPSEVEESAPATEPPETAGEGGSPQPTFTAPVQAPFTTAKAVAELDSQVGAAPARLELLGVQRSGQVVYVWVRIVNMDDQQAHTAAELLGLRGGDFDTPRLVDPAGKLSYQVSQTAQSCDCARQLDTVVLKPFEQRSVDAEFVLTRPADTVDVTVPAFGTFRHVRLQ